MDPTERTPDFFKAGGTLHLEVPSYVERPADTELFEQLLAGRFCYVLTSRQMGKSSLMLRTAARLRDCGVRTAIVDLSGLGVEVTIEQWYLGLIRRLGRELALPVEPEQWWQARQALTPVQRFTDFLHDVVLAEIDSQIVIFIDEIDSTLKLPFTDDFFAAIRFVYNRRASQPEYDRLTFALLGVAAPTDLIQDSSRTPFNIGQAIDLQELRLEEAQPLRQGLEQVRPGEGERLLSRIFYWTNGHPYLTQKLCLALAERAAEDWTDRRVDRLVEQQFFSEEGQKDDNLQFVRRNIEENSDRRPLLQFYRRVYQGEVVTEDERSRPQNSLKLIGLVGVTQRRLRVRNEIYRRVFDLAWIKENTPFPWAKYITVGGSFISVLTIVFLIVFLQWQREQALQTKVETLSERFHRSVDADIRLNSLAGLCSLEQVQTAQELFFDLPPQEQLNIFHHVKVEGAGEKLVNVVYCLHPAIENRQLELHRKEALLTVMYCALERFDQQESHRFGQQIGQPGQCEPAAEENHE